MKKHILTLFLLIFSFPLLAQPVLLFDTSVLKEERESQHVILYSRSNEMSNIRKSLVLLAERLKNEKATLAQELEVAGRGVCNDQARAIYYPKKADIEGRERACIERYHAEKVALNTQDKNVYKKIKVIIDKIAKRLGTSEVISHDSDSTTTMSPYLTYAGRPTVDITEEVLETLNKEYLTRAH